jgi:hypothetical protein
MHWQKARILWLKEADANPKKKYHHVMSSRKRCNAITGVEVKGERIKGVNKVREAVFNHFENHFKYDRW